jgi:hypothetical protein
VTQEMERLAPVLLTRLGDHSSLVRIVSRLGDHRLVLAISHHGELGRDLSRDRNSAHKTRRIEISPKPSNTTLGMRHRLTRLCYELSLVELIMLWSNYSLCGCLMYLRTYYG